MRRRIFPECTGKIAYPTKAEALHRIDAQMKRKCKSRRLNGHRKLIAYECRVCHNWHVGGTHLKPAKSTDARGQEGSPCTVLDQAMLKLIPASALPRFFKRGRDGSSELG